MKNNAFLLIVLLTLIACGFDPVGDSVSFGKDFISSHAALVVIDTFSVKLSTVMTDSISTSEYGSLWTGKYNDNEFGTVSASAFFELQTPGNFDYNESDRYDSLTLTLYISSKYMGDTILQNIMQVYQIKEVLESDPSGYFYNKSNIPLNDREIGRVAFLPRPNSSDSVQIRLSDDLGLSLWERIISNNDSLFNQENFLQYFKGICISPFSNNSSVISFKADSTLKITLHSTRPGIENTQVRSFFRFNSSSNKKFNTFIANYGNTVLRDIGTIGKLPSNETSQKAFMQSGTGLFTRVDFPTMQSINEFTHKSILIKAELIVKPVPGSYGQIELPAELALFHTDKYDRIVSEIVDGYGYSIFADFLADYTYHENSIYTFDITDFITSEISNAIFDTDHGLFIGESSLVFGNSLNRVVFSDDKISVYKPIVKLYFLYYNI